MSKIGVHVSKVSKVISTQPRKNMLDAIRNDCAELNIKCCQIFVAGPANTKMAHMEYKDIKTYCDESDIHLYVHSSYLTIGIFSINKDTNDMPRSKAAIKHLIDQLNACDQLGARGFVVHLPRKEPLEIIETFKYIIPILNKYKTPFMIEMPASKSDPTRTYETPDKMNILNDMMFTFPKFINWSWVIDTAHLWSCGIEVNRIKHMEQWFSNQKYPEKIGLFHLNGSSLDLYGTGKDKHRVVFSNEDDIWSQDTDIINKKGELDKKKLKQSTLYMISKFTKKLKIDLICEINRGEYDAILYSINTLNKIF
jgi:endonuclease IV